MKTTLFFALATVLTFTACRFDTDLAVPEPVFLPDAPLQGKFTQEASQGNASLSRTYCVQLETVSALVGEGELHPLKERPSSFTARVVRTAVASETALISIKASGQTVSEKYGRGLSEMELEYNARLNKLTGYITTRFHQGEASIVKIEAEPDVVNERNAMILIAKPSGGEFFDGSEYLVLANGKIEIALPLRPQGWFESNVSSEIMFCSASIN